MCTNAKQLLCMYWEQGQTLNVKQTVLSWMVAIDRGGYVVMWYVYAVVEYWLQLQRKVNKHRLICKKKSVCDLWVTENRWISRYMSSATSLGAAVFTVADEVTVIGVLTAGGCRLTFPDSSSHASSSFILSDDKRPHVKTSRRQWAPACADPHFEHICLAVILICVGHYFTACLSSSDFSQFTVGTFVFYLKGLIHGALLLLHRLTRWCSFILCTYGCRRSNYWLNVTEYTLLGFHRETVSIPVSTQSCKWLIMWSFRKQTHTHTHNDGN